MRDLNAPLHRSGGNGTTTYNWQNNAWNHAADWYFESIAESSSAAGADGDDFITTSKNGGAQAMLTIPIIGWVAKLGPSRASLASYNTNKYGPQTATDQWFPAAGNGIGTNPATHTSWIITTNDPNDANLPADTNFQAGWVQHLTNTWHSATNGGLVYYIMDNEWSLWQSTHRDIHPVGPTMDEVFTDYCNYATMVKGIDPNAQVAGPEEWSWPGYFYSGYDQQWSGANNDYNPAHYPDRIAHGGQDFGPWFLTQVNLRSQAAGKRLLDVFTLHCYPQENGVGGDAVDSATELLRNESTRQFWDTNYTDPSWINSVIALIPRMRSWVTTNYPGTKIGVTEYNWGAESSINGATAQADILGIFGREGLDLATRWTCPGTNSPIYNSFRMYRNYDGNKSTFGDTSVRATVPNPDNLSAFAAIRTNDSALTLMVINKDILNATPLRAVITNFANSGTAPGLATHRGQCHHPSGGCSLYQRHPQQPGAVPEHHLVRPADGQIPPDAGRHQRSGETDGIMDGWARWPALHPAILHQSDVLGGGQHQHVFDQLLPVPSEYGQPVEPVLSRHPGFTVTAINLQIPGPVLLTSRPGCSIVWPCGAFTRGQAQAPTRSMAARPARCGLN